MRSEWTVPLIMTLAFGILLLLLPGVPESTPAPLRTEDRARPQLTIPEPPPSRSVQTLSYDPRHSPEPTGSDPQSKLWTHDGAWWASMVDAESGEWRIHRHDSASDSWVGTGVLIDERGHAGSDALWDGTSLYVVSGGPKDYARDHLRLTRFRYEPTTRRFLPDAGFPVAISANGVRDFTLAKDTTGRLWIAYIQGGWVQVNRTLGGDGQWGEAFVPPVEGTAVDDDQVAVVAYGSQVGLLWSNQEEDAFYFAARDDGAAEDVWHPTTTVLKGPGFADNHVNVTSDGRGQLYAAVKTSLGGLPASDPQAEQVLLLTRDDQGEWRRHVVGLVADRHTRPKVAIDIDHDVVYVLATAGDSPSAVYCKSAPFDRLVFPPGLGRPFITSQPGGRLTNATLTKQPVGASTGLMALAADDSTGSYHHATVPLVPGQRSC
jgi:hypothetical protein